MPVQKPSGKNYVQEALATTRCVIPNMFLNGRIRAAEKDKIQNWAAGQRYHVHGRGL